MRPLIALSTFAVLTLVSAYALAAGGSVDKLKIIDKKVGHGAEAVPGASVTVDYTGWLYNANARNHHGKKFDSSLDRGKPFTFTLDNGQVIKGWDKGIEGMREGGERTLVIPPNLAYGSRGAGNVIPPNATLIFDVRLHKVRKQLPRSLSRQDSDNG
ncbi:MAG: FKBP-type peptidyl-prolyl cis-trans isomerase [Salinisphaera sp.]|jgi:FKBP-type peptidyl-prolyl cis-trans isomerase FkpA|nr:FKBP-type peptidyl-prolyl cis-trans isomerase [Salinisphaera sp.]